MNKREVVEALLAGKDVRNTTGARLHFNPNMNGSPFCFIHSSGEIDHMHLSTWESLGEFRIVEPWQENIGKGKLCWVWDSNPQQRVVRLVTCYDSIYEFPYRGYCTGYRHAEPLTPEELKEYSI